MQGHASSEDQEPRGCSSQPLVASQRAWCQSLRQHMILWCAAHPKSLCSEVSSPSTGNCDNDVRSLPVGAKGLCQVPAPQPLTLKALCFAYCQSMRTFKQSLFEGGIIAASVCPLTSMLSEKSEHMLPFLRNYHTVTQYLWLLLIHLLRIMQGSWQIRLKIWNSHLEVLVPCKAFAEYQSEHSGCSLQIT